MLSISQSFHSPWLWQMWWSSNVTLVFTLCQGHSLIWQRLRQNYDVTLVIWPWPGAAMWPWSDPVMWPWSEPVMWPSSRIMMGLQLYCNYTFTSGWINTFTSDCLLICIVVDLDFRLQHPCCCDMWYMLRGGNNPHGFLNMSRTKMLCWSRKSWSFSWDIVRFRVILKIGNSQFWPCGTIS